MLYDINIEAWNKIETFLQRDVNNIYICVYFDIYSYFYILHLRDKRNWIAEYSRIKASFSHELLLMLKSDNINQENTKSYPFTK